MGSHEERVARIAGTARCLEGEVRDTFLREACGADTELRTEVETQLAGERPPLISAVSQVGTTVGPYRLSRILGEGGMGVVYLAEQVDPIRRQVALKLIKLGMDTSQVVARFEAERQALALMDHPNVAQVYDAGATGTGRPYFVMELVRGVPITQYCDSRRLTVEQRLRLFLRVCEGVQHAHHKGIIHRDLKPSNVLVTVQGDEAIPKIIDFGVAKATSLRLTERSVFTELGVLVGTPEYMSPEQAEMTNPDVDTRTDVYSLGVLLYELLTGVLPFGSRELRRAGFDEIRRKIRDEEPSKPSTRVSSLGRSASRSAHLRGTEPRALARELEGELDWIVVRALEKDRTERYGSPKHLADDVLRHLSHEPILASPPGLFYRARKFVRRNRAACLTTTLGIVALVGVSLWLSVLYRRAAGSELLARDRAYVSAIKTADLGVRTSRLEDAEAALRSCDREKRGWEWGHLWFRVHPELAQEAHSIQDEPLPAPTVGASRRGLLARSRDGSWRCSIRSRITTRDDRGFTSQAEAVEVHGAGTSAASWSRTGPPFPSFAAFDSAGERLAAAVWSDDLPDCPQLRFEFLERQGSEWRSLRSSFESSVRWPCMSEARDEEGLLSFDGDYLAFGRPSGEILVRHADMDPVRIETSPGLSVLEIFADRGMLLTGSEDGRVSAWDLKVRPPRRVSESSHEDLRSLDLSPDGRLIASGSPSRVAISDSHTGETTTVFVGPRSDPFDTLRFLDDRKVAVETSDRLLHFSVSQRTVGYEIDLPHPVSSLAVAEDGAVVATGFRDVVTRVRLDDWLGLSADPVTAASEEDAPTLSARTRDSTGDPVAARRLSVSPGGSLFVKVLDSGLATFDAGTGTRVDFLEGVAGRPISVVVSADERWVVGVSGDGPVNIWDLEERRHAVLTVASDRVEGPAAISPDSRTLAIATPSGVDLWALDGLRHQGELSWDADCELTEWVISSHVGDVSHLVFSTSGQRLAAGRQCLGRDGSESWIEVIWDVPRKTVAGRLSEARCFASQTVFSPDGSRLVLGLEPRGLGPSSCGVSGIEVYGTENLRLLARFETPTAEKPAAIMGLAFAADGRRLISGDRSGRLRVWDSRWP